MGQISGRARSARAGLFAAALLGTAAGMRAALPLAALPLAGVAGLGRRKQGRLAVPALLGSLAELVIDKLPSTGDRTSGPGMAARLASGALCGGVVARRRGAPAALGAITGALCALAATHLFHRLRRQASAHVPPLVAALGEDLLAATVATRALRASR